MRMILVYLPIIVLMIGWFLGHCRITRALGCLAATMVATEALLVAFLVTLELGYLIFAIFVAMFGIIGSVAFSFATSRKISPAPVHYVVAGIKQAATTYQGLHPDTKARVNKFARVGARVAAYTASQLLREKGYGKSADALRRGAKFI